MWEKVAMVPLLRQTIVLLDGGPRWPSAVVPTVNAKRERRTRSASFATLPFDRGPKVPPSIVAQTGGRFGHGRLR
jgi:hypothetical protein